MRVAIVIDSVPSYRQGFYESLLANPEIELTVYCQSHIKGFNLHVIHRELGGNFVEVPFISTGRHQAAWQSLPIRHLLRNFDVYFFHGNPRIVSTLLWATLFRLAGKKVIIWGQAHTASANPTTEAIRLMWWRLFRNFLVYTDAEVEYLRNRGFGRKRMLGMNNGLDQGRIDDVKEQWPEHRLVQWQQQHGLQGRTVLLSCARLIDKNRFDVMLEALPALADMDESLVWAVIGSGEEADALRSMASDLGVNDRIRWVGEVYDESELAPWFMSSKLLVHPGAIGLTLMHAFGYGLPVVTHGNVAHHMPEIAAFDDGVNGRQFREGDAESLVDAVSAMLRNAPLLSSMSAAALSTVRDRYNTNVMATRFCEVARLAVSD